MKILVDTNILVYAYDPGELERQGRAIQLLDQLHLSGTGRLSVQCLGEFFSATTRPLRLSPPRLTTAEALQSIEQMARHFEVYPLTSITILEACRGVRDHQLSYYDSQIWAIARLNQVSVVFTEDFQHGQTLEGVQFINPFNSEFILSDWL
jgi:predicted nucleic acid-binding protein